MIGSILIGRVLWGFFLRYPSTQKLVPISVFHRGIMTIQTLRKNQCTCATQHTSLFSCFFPAGPSSAAARGPRGAARPPRFLDEPLCRTRPGARSQHPRGTTDMGIVYWHGGIQKGVEQACMAPCLNPTPVLAAQAWWRGTRFVGGS